MKVERAVSDRLLNLLYTTTLKEVATKVPIVTKVLYQQDDSPSGSVLDSLAENEWKQQPVESAVGDLPTGPLTKHRSNILKFACPNSYISEKDFQNLFPINRERRYNLVGEMRRNGLPFRAIKGRNPSSLLHSGTYYLLFECYKHACVYWMEMRDKMVNGFDIKLEFVIPKESELKYMLSPFFDTDINGSLKNKPLPILDLVPKTPLSTIFHSSKRKLQQTKQLKKASASIDRTSDSYTLLDTDPTHDILLSFLDVDVRNRSVLVRNLPIDLSPHALPKLLWDYDLADLPDLSDCFTTVRLDPVNQVHLKVIRFADHTNAQRFVRNYHGKKWHLVQAGDDKPLPKPILCEVLQ